MADLTIEVKCESYGKVLDAEFDRYNTLQVTPCDVCKESEYQRGYDEGKSDGYQSGFSDCKDNEN